MHQPLAIHALLEPNRPFLKSMWRMKAKKTVPIMMPWEINPWHGVPSDHCLPHRTLISRAVRIDMSAMRLEEFRHPNRAPLLTFRHRFLKYIYRQPQALAACRAIQQVQWHTCHLPETFLNLGLNQIINLDHKIYPLTICFECTKVH